MSTPSISDPSAERAKETMLAVTDAAGSQLSVAEPGPSSIDPTDFERAFAAVESEVRAVSEPELIHITIDVRLVAVNTVARLPRILELRDQMVGLSGFDVGALDGLANYALAAVHAYFLNQTSVATPAEVSQLAELAQQRRSVLLASVKALVAHGLVDEGLLEGLAGPVGYRNIAYDVVLLRNVVVDVWPQVAGKTLLTAEDLEQDAAIASQLLLAAGEKSVTPSEPSESALLRDQAFTLFVQKYEQVRRAVAYVRWNEGDADSYAPSLYAGRGSRRREAQTEDTLPSTPAVGGAGQPATAANDDRSTTGTPDASPFTP